MSQCAYAAFAGDTRSSIFRRECSRDMVAAKPARYLNVRRSGSAVVLSPLVSSEVRCQRNRIRVRGELGARSVGGGGRRTARSRASGGSTRGRARRSASASVSSGECGGGPRPGGGGLVRGPRASPRKGPPPPPGTSASRPPPALPTPQARRTLARPGVTRAVPKSLPPRRYREIENRWRTFADAIGIPLAELDL